MTGSRSLSAGRPSRGRSGSLRRGLPRQPHAFDLHTRTDEPFGLDEQAEAFVDASRRGEAPNSAQACVEDIDYAARRELDKALVGQRATCR